MEEVQVSDVVSAEDGVTSGWDVVVWTADGEARRVQHYPDRKSAIQAADVIAQALATWDGFKI